MLLAEKTSCASASFAVGAPARVQAVSSWRVHAGRHRPRWELPPTAGVRRKGDVSLEKYPNVAAWMKRVESREGYEASAYRFFYPASNEPLGYIFSRRELAKGFESIGGGFL